MSDIEQIWRDKSDEDLLEAAANLEDFTEEGQQVIRAELKRRGMEDPVEQVGEFARDTSTSEPEEGGPDDAPRGEADATLPEPECLRCHTEMRYRGARTMLGATGNLFSNSETLDLYVCPRCGHAELFASEVASDQG